MTIVKITLRGDDIERDRAGMPKLRANRAIAVRAPAETVDLDRLSPKARALAEAIAATDGHAVTDIWMESRATVAEMHGPGWELWFTADEASRPERRPWRGWGPYPIDSPMDPRDYLEQQAAKIPDGWHVYGAHPHQPVPSKTAGAAVREATRDQVLGYLRAHGRDITPATWSSYVARGQAPAPSRRIVRTPLWDLDDIDVWLASRPG